MAKKQKSVQQIRAEIQSLKDELKQAETFEAQHLGKLALAAGFGGVDANDTDIVSAMKDAAARFQAATQ